MIAHLTLRPMAVRYVLPFLLLTATATAQPIPDTLRAPAEADSVTVFGWTVDADADRLLVGARVWPPPYPRAGGHKAAPEDAADHHGTVFVYRRQADGAWEVEGRLKADYISREDCFSWSMDLRGDLAAVGAECEYRENSKGSFQSGAVYLYRFDGAAWVREAKLVLPNGEGAQISVYRFGESVALGDGFLVVGSGNVSNPSDPDDDYASGAAFVFERDGGAWSLSATLRNEDMEAQVNEYFGGTVGVAGDAVLVGAPNEDGPETEGRGAVYVFEKPGDAWTQTTKVTAPVAGPERFGALLAAETGKAVVGSRTAVYPLDREAGGWTVGTSLLTEDKPYAVARNGDRILTVDVGAEEGTTGHLFTRSGMRWSGSAFVVPRFTVGRDELGSLTDQQAFVGVPTTEGGEVLVYDLSQLVDGEPAAGGPSALALSTAPNPVAGRTTIRFETPRAGHVRLTAYDVLGREVARIAEGARPAAAQAVEFDASRLAPGLYFLRLETEGEAVTQRLTVVR